MKLIDRFPKEFSNFTPQVLHDLSFGVEIYDAAWDMKPVKEPGQSILVSDRIPTHDVLRLMKATGIYHFVQTQRTDLTREMVISCLLRKSPRIFFESPFTFLFPKQLAKTEGTVTVGDWRFQKPSDKMNLLKEAAVYFTRHPSIRKFEPNARMILDEMLANATIDAPRETVPPTVVDPEFGFPNKLEGRMRIGFNTQRIALMVEDPFGSLRLPHLIDKLLVSMSPVGVKPNLSPNAGAGLGCKMIIERSTSFYAAVWPGVRTAICCSFPVDRGFAKIEGTPRNFHLSIAD